MASIEALERTVEAARREWKRLDDLSYKAEGVGDDAGNRAFANRAAQAYRHYLDVLSDLDRAKGRDVHDELLMQNQGPPVVPLDESLRRLEPHPVLDVEAEQPDYEDKIGEALSPFAKIFSPITNIVDGVIFTVADAIDEGVLAPLGMETRPQALERRRHEVDHEGVAIEEEVRVLKQEQDQDEEAFTQQMMRFADERRQQQEVINLMATEVNKQVDDLQEMVDEINAQRALPHDMRDYKGTEEKKVEFTLKKEAHIELRKLYTDSVENMKKIDAAEDRFDREKRMTRDQRNKEYAQLQKRMARAKGLKKKMTDKIDRYHDWKNDPRRRQVAKAVLGAGVTMAGVALANRAEIRELYKQGQGAYRQYRRGAGVVERLPRPDRRRKDAKTERKGAKTAKKKGKAARKKRIQKVRNEN